MKRLTMLFIFAFAMITLAACGEDPVDDVIDPTFNGIEVNERDPMVDEDFAVYMAEKNELLTLEIFLDNPSNLNINSIKINGTTYRQTRFEADSTPQHIIFNFDVLRVPGETTYVLEEIEYTHPVTGVETLNITRDNRYLVYVLESAPTADFTQITPSQESINVAFELRDADDTLTDGRLELVLADEVIETLDLTAGIFSHTFDALLSDVTYELRVLASYERGDGQMVNEDVVLNLRDDVTTLEKTTPNLEIHGILSDVTEVSFDIDITDPDAVGSLNKIELLLDDTVMATLTDMDELTFTDLLSDTTYDIRVEYLFDLNDNQGERSLLITESFTTTAKAAPVVDTENETSTHDSVTFDLMFFDADNVLVDETLTVTIYLDETLIDTQQVDIATLENITFTGLFNNNLYTVEVYGSYDLNDGDGIQDDIMLKTFEIATPEREIPDISVETTTISESHLIFNIDATPFEPFLTEPYLRIYIYDENTNTLLKEATLIHDNLTFEILDLLANQTIRLEVEATFDLDDGEGSHTGIIFVDYFMTAANTPPSATIDSVSLTQESIRFTYNLSDPQATLVPDTFIAEIYEDDGESLILLDTVILDPASGEFTYDYQPKSSYTYSIKLYADYNLRDGEEDTTKYHLDAVYEVTNLEAKAPVAYFDAITSTNSEIHIDYRILDIDETIIDMTITINGQTIDLSEIVDTIVVADLLSNTEYTISLNITYVRKDETRTMSIEDTVTTAAQTEPGLTYDTLTSDQTSISFTYAIADPDSTGEITAIELYHDAVLVDELTDLSLRSFTDLYSDNTYVIRTVYTYDLNDGAGEQTLEIETSIPTDALSVATADIEVMAAGLKGIEFDILVEDSDATLIDGTLEVVLFDASSEIARWSMASLSDSFNHEALFDDRTLRIEVIGDYDLNDGEGVQETVVLFEYEIIIEAFADFDPETITEDNIKAVLDLSDYEDIVDLDSLITEIYYAEKDRLIASGDMSDYVVVFDVTGLLADQDITFVVRGDYDLGSGVQHGELFTITIRTDANESPTGSITGVDFEADDILVDVQITDSDAVIISGTTIVHLYYEDEAGNMVYQDSKILPDDESGQITFAALDLEPQAFYYLVLETSYYLRDGRGDHENKILGTNYIRVDVQPDAPTASIDNIEIAKGQVTFDVLINDPHNTLVDDSLVALLYKDGTEVDRIAFSELETTLSFDTLLNDTVYDLIIRADYDLYEADLIEDDTLVADTFTSYDAAPIVEMNNITKNVGSISFDLSIDDFASSIDTDTLYAVLMLGQDEVSRIKLDTLFESVTFTELENDTAYEIVIEADVDYLEATIRQEEILDSYGFTSLDVAPSIDYDDIIRDYDRIDFTVRISDGYQTLIETYQTLRVEDAEGNLVTELTEVEDGTQVTLFNLLAGHDYTFKLYGTIDYQDGQGQRQVLLHEAVISTLAYAEPVVSIDDVVTTEHEITYTVNETDPDNRNTITDIVLFEDGVAIESEDTPGTGTFTFSNLKSDTEYRIVVSYEYDLADGEGLIETTTEIYVTTDAYDPPTVSIIDVSTTEETISFNTSTNDPDELIEAILIIELYLDGVLVDSIDPSTEPSPYTFSDLYANTAYIIKVTYTYDLKDGEGVQTGSFDSSLITTDAYAKPTGELTNLTITGDDINIDVINYSDPDGRLDDMRLELYQDGVLVDTLTVNSDGTYTFTDAYAAESNYVIRLVADYDLNEPGGPIEEEIFDKVTFATAA